MNSVGLERRIETPIGEIIVVVPEGPIDLFLWPGVLFDERLHAALDRALASRGIRAAHIRPPGFGGSSLSRRRFTLSECGQAYLAIADALDVERPVFGGTSWGGATSAHAALLAPDRVRAIIPCNAPWLSGARSGPLSWIPNLAASVPSRVYAIAAVPVAISLPGSARVAPEMVRAMGGALASATRRDRYAVARAVFRHRTPLMPMVDRIRCPALVVAGDRDTLCPLASQRQAAERIPEGQIAVFPGTGHLTALEASDGVAEAIASFLATV